MNRSVWGITAFITGWEFIYADNGKIVLSALSHQSLTDMAETVKIKMKLPMGGMCCESDMNSKRNSHKLMYVDTRKEM